MLIAISGLAKYRLTKKIPVLGESGMFRFTSLYRTTFHLCNHAQEVIQLLALEYVQLTISLLGTKG
jgi:hypothetical protein